MVYETIRYAKSKRWLIISLYFLKTTNKATVCDFFTECDFLKAFPNISTGTKTIYTNKKAFNLK